MFIQELNYKDERGIPATFFNNARAQQVVGVETLFSVLREAFDIENVIEIGTAQGGLANILACVFTVPCIHTFDIVNMVSGIYRDNVELHIADCWQPSFIEEYKALLVPGKTLFVIDGGDKRKEINILSPHALPGDILMVHDFCTDEATFQKTGKQIWSCLEIQESDINLDTLKRSDLYSYGLNYAWGIYETLDTPARGDTP